MGADIHIFLEIKKAGKWERSTEKIFPYYGEERSDAPFDWRSYGMFGFLANVRNYSHVPVLGELKGLPEDSEYLNSDHEVSWFYGNESVYTVRQNILDDYDYHSHTYYTLKELLYFDYDKTFEDRRYTDVIKNEEGTIVGSNGAAVTQEGEGTIVSFREFLHEQFFECIGIMKTLGDPEDIRIVFYFDN